MRNLIEEYVIKQNAHKHLLSINNNDMKTITHTNGFPVFSKLKTETQNEVNRRFVVPTDEPYLYVDEYNRPFVQRPNEPRMMCKIRKTALIDGGFHSTQRKN